MKATLVIPTYKRSDRLRQLLACLIDQRAHPDGSSALAQVIVCDDGSPDDTREVARSFSDRLPLVYCWQEDRGFRAGQARNMGIARAEGDVVIFALGSRAKGASGAPGIRCRGAGRRAFQVEIVSVHPSGARRSAPITMSIPSTVPRHSSRGAGASAPQAVRRSASGTARCMRAQDATW